GPVDSLLYNDRMAFLDYDLPSRLIAQQPAPDRDGSRLLHLPRDGSIVHRRFRDLPDMLRPSDLLVLNNTRVLQARLFGRRERTAGQWEGLFIQQKADGLWEVMSQTRGTLRAGEFIQIEPGPLRLELVERLPEGHWQVRPDRPGSFSDLLSVHGHMPLPPYIRKGRAGR